MAATDYESRLKEVMANIDLLKEIMNNDLLTSDESLRLRAKEVELGAELDVMVVSDFSVGKLDLPQISKDLLDEFFAKELSSEMNESGIEFLQTSGKTPASGSPLGDAMGPGWEALRVRMSYPKLPKEKPRSKVTELHRAREESAEKLNKLESGTFPSETKLKPSTRKATRSAAFRLRSVPCQLWRHLTPEETRLFPPTTLQGDGAAHEKAKDTQTYDVEDSESESESGKEQPMGVTKTTSPMTAYLEKMFSKRLDAQQSMAQHNKYPKAVKPDRNERDERPSPRPTKDSGNRSQGRNQNRPIEKAEGMAVSMWPDISHLYISKTELVNVLRQMGQQVKWP
ncbi:hypothetical protein F2Q69_00006195 [Brassica cretica]|uniref:Uncharacterized protein n=1 Tax=Brassica cretica TaxID=69181 RepID=A0A8S9NSQ3_BRACR|nr:hypothetical protein F2Q69_00006195 [Brassica cretica]